MRAALLNSSRMGYLPPEGGDPRDPAIDTTETPVPGGVVVSGPPVPSQGFDIEKAKAWWESGQALAAAGASNGLSINPSALLSAAATGAAAGAAIAGLGAVAGAIIAVGVYVVGAIFGGERPSQWDNAGQNVHWWFTNYAQQDYLTWIESTGNTGVWESVQKSAQGLLTWWLTTYDYVIYPGGTFYNGRGDMDYAYEAAGTTNPETAYAWARQFYGNLGIDWDATVALWAAEGRSDTILMKNRVFIGAADGAPDDEQGAGGTSAVGPVLIGAGLLYLATRNASN